MKVRKLGRGLDILLDRARARAGGTGEARESAAASGAERAGDGGPESPRDRDEVRRIPIQLVQPNPSQPRAALDRRELESLKASVAKEGILQPVLVRRAGDGFELVAGERRFRAAQELGLDAIPAIVIEVGDERMLELALIENIHRLDLNPIDTAKAFRALVALKGWTQEVLAQSLGISRSLVTNTLRLLELPENIQTALAKGQIQSGHAKILLAINGAREQQQLFERIAEDRLSVRELELARQEVAPGSETPGSGVSERKRVRRGGARKSAETIALEDELSRAVGTKVTILERRGKGVIRLEFYSPEDFEHLRSLLLADRTGG